MSLRSALFAILMIFPALSHCEEEYTKVYVEPSQITFVEHEIFVCVEGNWVSADLISADASGIYAKVKDDPYHGRRWICPKCRYNNYPSDAFCQNWLYNNSGRYQCLYPRPE